MKGNYVDVPALRCNSINRNMKPAILFEYNQHIGGIK